MYKYYKLYKPYGYLSQFTKEVEHHKTLAHLLEVAQDVYPIGRLDKDSEGLLLLTNNRSLTQKLLHPKFAHERTYWVQVEGQVEASVLIKLKAGVPFRSKKKKYTGRATQASLIPEAPLPPRDPPIRERENIPTTWISLTLTEGKHRQVRKMMAALKHPVLRLVRYSIQKITIDKLKVGEWKEVPENQFLERLQLK